MDSRPAGFKIGCACASARTRSNEAEREKPMAIDLTLAVINATVEIDQAQPDGVRIAGTGFLLQDPTPDGKPRVVLVTARHLFDDMPGEEARIGWRIALPDGSWRFAPQTLKIRDGKTPLWTQAGNVDVAAIAIDAPPEFAKAAIPLAWLGDETAFDKFHVGPGDEMMVLGYPEGLAANPAGFPIVRSGRVASYPLSPISAFPTFLLDFRVFRGNSGGPVFMTEDVRRRPGLENAPPVRVLAGMLASQAMAGTDRMEVGVVTPSVFIRQTVALLDQAPAVPATTPAAADKAQPAAPKP
jgi:S1-C subfamily serine protease